VIDFLSTRSSSYAAQKVGSGYLQQVITQLTAQSWESVFQTLARKTAVNYRGAFSSDYAQCSSQRPMIADSPMSQSRRSAPFCSKKTPSARGPTINHMKNAKLSFLMPALCGTILAFTRFPAVAAPNQFAPTPNIGSVTGTITWPTDLKFPPPTIGLPGRGSTLFTIVAADVKKKITVTFGRQTTVGKENRVSYTVTGLPVDTPIRLSIQSPPAPGGYAISGPTKTPTLPIQQAYASGVDFYYTFIIPHVPRRSKAR
jgi:hypothetical protein